MKESLLKVSYPWWVWAIFAVFVAFGETQDNAKRLSGASGWGLAGTWLLIALGVFTFVFAGYIAILKYRARAAMSAGE